MRRRGFGFFPNRHEPGTQTLRGKTYAPDLKGGIQAVRDLAHDPHTAHHIATKFATYFIADKPSPQSVARLEDVFNRHRRRSQGAGGRGGGRSCCLDTRRRARCARRWNM